MPTPKKSSKPLFVASRFGRRYGSRRARPALRGGRGRGRRGGCREARLARRRGGALARPGPRRGVPAARAGISETSYFGGRRLRGLSASEPRRRRDPASVENPHGRTREPRRYLDDLGIAGDAAEVGAAYGDFSRRVLDTWTGLGTLTVVDSYAGSYAARQQVLEATLSDELRSGRATLRRKSSTDAAAGFNDASLAFVYLDGDKDRVGADLAAWWPKVRPPSGNQPPLEGGTVRRLVTHTGPSRRRRRGPRRGAGSGGGRGPVVFRDGRERAADATDGSPDAAARRPRDSRAAVLPDLVRAEARGSGRVNFARGKSPAGCRAMLTRVLRTATPTRLYLP